MVKACNAGILLAVAKKCVPAIRENYEKVTLANDQSIVATFPSSRLLDDLNYKSIMIGFPLLTLGIITGAAWANYAWGTYWSWDPKET